MGVAPGGVAAYSSDYDNIVDEKWAGSRDVFRAVDPTTGVFLGYRYQCVEFARRWLVEVHGITFASVGMAYEIFDLPAFERVAPLKGGDYQGNAKRTPSPKQTNPVPLVKTRNGHAGPKPVVGSVILWAPIGYFIWTGHVGIVVDITETEVRIAEQNVWDHDWEGKNYSRSLPWTTCCGTYDGAAGCACGGAGSSQRVVVYDLAIGEEDQEFGRPSAVLGWVTPAFDSL
jgi:glutathionylspermidine amidase/synthetase